MHGSKVQDFSGVLVRGFGFKEPRGREAQTTPIPKTKNIRPPKKPQTLTLVPHPNNPNSKTQTPKHSRKPSTQSLAWVVGLGFRV